MIWILVVVKTALSEALGSEELAGFVYRTLPESVHVTLIDFRAGYPLNYKGVYLGDVAGGNQFTGKYKLGTLA